MDDVYFAEHALVEINVPESSVLDIESALSEPEPDVTLTAESLVPTIYQRSTLYFDEAVPILVIIRVPRSDEETLKSMITRLNVSVEAHVFNDPATTTPDLAKGGPPQQDVIWTGKLNPKEEPVVVMEESAEDDDTPTALLIWKITAMLNRARIRLTSPVIVWKVTSFLNPQVRNARPVDNKYLPSGKPLQLNLLASLSDKPHLDERTPSLTTARLTRPGRSEFQNSNPPIPLKVLSREPIPILPAVTSRIKFHRSHKLGDLPTIAASLELDIPHSAPKEIDLLSIELNLSKGRVEQMVPEHSIQLPKTCRPRDSLVWLYTMSPLSIFDDPMASPQNIHILDVSIVAMAMVSDICKPETRIKWRTNVDFSTAMDSVQKSFNPIVAPLQLARPPPKGASETIATTHSLPPAVTGDPELDSLDYATTFVPPDNPIYVGEPFKWRVIVVNRTAKPAHLALTALQKRRVQPSKRHSHQSSTGSVTAVSKSGITAESFVDENLLYATVKAGGPETAHLVALSADIKIGPLAPGGAGEAELEFLPMIKGWLQLEAVRLTDMTTSEYIDIRYLPDVVALERPAQISEKSES